MNIMKFAVVLDEGAVLWTNNENTAAEYQAKDLGGNVYEVKKTDDEGILIHATSWFGPAGIFSVHVNYVIEPRIDDILIELNGFANKLFNNGYVG